jgi:hypothetical protein
MAAQDGPHLAALDRPRRIGQRLVERFGLTPPVNVRTLLNHYAEVESISIPADCDALVIGLNVPSVVRPRVIVNRDKPHRRQRFSMAHELGHILIPGHISIGVCFMEYSFYDSSSDDEREAHAFASELLMPTRWLAEIVAATDNPSEIFASAEVADVSAAAAMLAINRLLAPGHVVCLMNGKVVEMALGSPGTIANLPEQGHLLDLRTIDPLAAEHGHVTFSGRQIGWWAFEAEAELGEEDDEDERTASEVLRAIADDVFADDADGRLRALASINGAAGWAKGAFGPAATVEEMLARLRGRLAGRTKHAAMMSHPLFETYLVKKARELTES